MAAGMECNNAILFTQSTAMLAYPFCIQRAMKFQKAILFFFYSGGSRAIGDSHRQASFGMALATIAHHHHYKALAFGAPSNVLRMCIFLLAFLFVCLSPLGQSVLLKCVTALS